VATPTQQQARRHHARQASIAAAAVTAIANLLRRKRPWAETLRTLASYQLASATAASRQIATWSDGSDTPLVDPNAFAGVSSGGFAISEPLIATIDNVVPAPVQPLPAPWWDDANAFMDQVQRLIESEVQDAGRSAAHAELVARPDWQNYVRMLVLPSCKRCVILAGRIYRDLDGFERHPTCDCVHVPVQSWRDAQRKGLVTTFDEAFAKGQVRGLSAADEQAIRDGANPTTVVNASQGLVTTELFGHKVKATSYGTTKRSAWRKQNPSRLVRLRPESIYKFATGREDALRLLRLYGYLT
jgi:hypothetical protein